MRGDGILSNIKFRTSPISLYEARSQGMEKKGWKMMTNVLSGLKYPRRYEVTPAEIDEGFCWVRGDGIYQHEIQNLPVFPL
jgi:hypothetical protein